VAGLLFGIGPLFADGVRQGTRVDPLFGG